VKAIAILTLAAYLKNFRKVMRHFIFVEVNGAKLADAGRIYYISAGRKLMHFCKGSSVAPVLCCTDIADVFKPKPGINAFTSVVFPTPECPEKKIHLFFISSRSIFICPG